MGRKKRNNYKFLDSAIMNDLTFEYYMLCFRRLCLSIFEWVNLPNSMNAIKLEKCLYENGQATFLKDKKYGFINTNCCSNGYINIYDLPSSLHCYSHDYQTNRKLYTGLPILLNDEEIEKKRKELETNECILIQNDWDRNPSYNAMELFAYRLTDCDRTRDVNIKAQKTPVMVIVDEKQRLLMENLYNQYNGNQPFIFGDKQQLSTDMLRAINTNAPFIADKVQDLKKEIWNEALTFLGINNIMIDKKERLVQDEANSNNELINLNLQSFFAPRQEACKQFNEKFGFTGTDKEISVRLRSDLHNTIKNMESAVVDYKPNQETSQNNINLKNKEGVKNG